jgi:predicted lactoylglutathione lyase
MTDAFRLYQEVLAEEKMEVFISTATGGSKPQTPIDDYERPKCPECDVELMLRLNVKDIDGKVWNTSWFCQKCLTDYYSEKTPQEWMHELRRKDV